MEVKVKVDDKTKRVTHFAFVATTFQEEKGLEDLLKAIASGVCQMEVTSEVLPPFSFRLFHEKDIQDDRD